MVSGYFYCRRRGSFCDAAQSKAAARGEARRPGGDRATAIGQRLDTWRQKCGNKNARNAAVQESGGKSKKHGTQERRIRE
jgi:hypothetical protein